MEHSVHSAAMPKIDKDNVKYSPVTGQSGENTSQPLKRKSGKDTLVPRKSSAPLLLQVVCNADQPTSVYKHKKFRKVVVVSDEAPLIEIPPAVRVGGEQTVRDLIKGAIKEIFLKKGEASARNSHNLHTEPYRTMDSVRPKNSLPPTTAPSTDPPPTTRPSTDLPPTTRPSTGLPPTTAPSILFSIIQRGHFPTGVLDDCCPLPGAPTNYNPQPMRSGDVTVETDVTHVRDRSPKRHSSGTDTGYRSGPQYRGEYESATCRVHRGVREGRTPIQPSPLPLTTHPTTSSPNTLTSSKHNTNDNPHANATSSSYDVSDARNDSIIPMTSQHDRAVVMDRYKEQMTSPTNRLPTTRKTNNDSVTSQGKNLVTVSHHLDKIIHNVIIDKEPRHHNSHKRHPVQILRHLDDVYNGAIPDSRYNGNQTSLIPGQYYNCKNGRDKTFT